VMCIRWERDNGVACIGWEGGKQVGVQEVRGKQASGGTEGGEGETYESRAR
jgi:hypothetical protein